MPLTSLRLTAAYYSLGLAGTEQLVNAAHAALDNGVYSYSLGELATVREPTWADCHPLFVAAVRELGLDVPDHAAAILTLVDVHATRLAEGSAGPEEVLGELYSVERAFWFDRPAKVAPEALAPLRPFIDLYYAVEEYRGYEEYRSAGGLTQPGGPVPKDLHERCIALAMHWCRDRWGPTLDRTRLTSTVVALAEGIYQDRAFDRLPILADALEDAGCDDTDILTHLRGEGPHVRGCWAVDLVLGKE